eukprot:862461-Alexandrium_andersonii.AAC.1
MCAFNTPKHSPKLGHRMRVVVSCLMEPFHLLPLRTHPPSQHHPSQWTAHPSRRRARATRRARTT